MQKITAPIAFGEEMIHFILRRYLGPSQTVLEKHPPNQGVEPRIDPMLESMSLNLMRLEGAAHNWAHGLLNWPARPQKGGRKRRLACANWWKSYKATIIGRMRDHVLDSLKSDGA